MWYYINLLIIILAYWSKYNHKNSRSVQNITIHFEYLKNKLRGLDVNWQPISGTLLFIDWTFSFLGLLSQQWNTVVWTYVLCNFYIHNDRVSKFFMLCVGLLAIPAVQILCLLALPKAKIVIEIPWTRLRRILQSNGWWP